MNKKGFNIGAASYIGEVKTSNQDRILVKIGEEESGEFGLFAVADGMGGLTHGDMAAELIIHRLAKWWGEKLSYLLKSGEVTFEAINRELNNTCRNINSELYTYCEKVNKKTGSTLSLLFIFRGYFLIQHTGDSRIYRFHDDELEQLTKDQSWVAMEVNKGRMTNEEAAIHPLRSMITMCMGAYSEIDLYERTVEAGEDDIFLLCSDGLYTCVSRDEINNELLKFVKGIYPDLQYVADLLVKMCRKRGACDNVSLILVQQFNNRKRNKLFPFLKLNKKPELLY